jgi:hypothetical protein
VQEEPGDAKSVAADDLEDVQMFDETSFDATVELNIIDSDLLAKIESIDTVQPLSSKSDLLVKHVAYIRRCIARPWTPK